MQSENYCRGEFEGSSNECLWPILFLHGASIPNNFISENGIVAVLGDENQFVNGGIRKINHPLSFERGHLVQIKMSDTYREELVLTLEVIVAICWPKSLSLSRIQLA